jgi:hypothetical protein
VEIPNDILPSITQGDKDRILGCINSLTLEIRNRLSTFPITKATLNSAPFQIMPVFRHILFRYEDLIAKNPEPQTEEPTTQTEEPRPQTKRLHLTYKGVSKKRTKERRKEVW